MKTRTEFLREHFNINPVTTISIEFVEHDLPQFSVFNVITGRADAVTMSEFWDNNTKSYFYAGYHTDNEKIYIRDLEREQS